jgi:glycosyltransferase involved in cell wall biosynthesis
MPSARRGLVRGLRAYTARGAGFGKPTAALRFGGFLDTVEEEESGVFFDEPTPAAIVQGLRELLMSSWDEQAIRAVSARFSEMRFIERLRTLAVVTPY